MDDELFISSSLNLPLTGEERKKLLQRQLYHAVGEQLLGSRNDIAEVLRMMIRK